MSFILSEQRDNFEHWEELQKNWHNYMNYLDDNKLRLPANAFDIAKSDWWYSFEEARAPHDSHLISIEMKDFFVSDPEDPDYSTIKITLESAFGGTILLYYPRVFRYRLDREPDSSGVHGDWRYDEFSCASMKGRIVHTIEWADGATWVIEASDLIHQYQPS